MLNGLRVASAVVLARFLVPADYAAFGAIVTFISFAQFVADLGLGGATIQQDAEPTERETAAIFTVQQAMAWLLVVLVWVAAPWWAVRLGLPRETVWMLRVYALTLPMATARIVPGSDRSRRVATSGSNR